MDKATRKKIHAQFMDEYHSRHMVGGKTWLDGVNGWLENNVGKAVALAVCTVVACLVFPATIPLVLAVCVMSEIRIGYDVEKKATLDMNRDIDSGVLVARYNEREAKSSVPASGQVQAVFKNSAAATSFKSTQTKPLMPGKPVY